MRYELLAVVSVAKPVVLKFKGVIILTSNPLEPPFTVDVILLPLASLTRDCVIMYPDESTTTGKNVEPPLTAP